MCPVTGVNSAAVTKNGISGVRPTKTSNSSLDTFLISIHLSLIGSVERGYAWTVALLSIEQVKLTPPSATLTKSPAENPWSVIFNLINPFLPSYDAVDIL